MSGQDANAISGLIEKDHHLRFDQTILARQEKSEAGILPLDPKGMFYRFLGAAFLRRIRINRGRLYR